MGSLQNTRRLGAGWVRPSFALSLAGLGALLLILLVWSSIGSVAPILPPSPGNQSSVAQPARTVQAAAAADGKNLQRAVRPPPLLSWLYRQFEASPTARSAAAHSVAESALRGTVERAPTGETLALEWPLEALFVPGEAEFSDAGTAQVRKGIRTLFAHTPDDVRLASHVRITVSFAEDQAPATSAMLRSYQEKMLALLRLLGVLAPDALIELPEPGMEDTRHGISAVPASGIANATVEGDAQGDDATTADDVPTIGVVLRRGGGQQVATTVR